MCHERWVRRSGEAVQLAYLRDLSQRDREEERTSQAVDDALTEASAREPVAAAAADR